MFPHYFASDKYEYTGVMSSTTKEPFDVLDMLTQNYLEINIDIGFFCPFLGSRISLLPTSDPLSIPVRMSNVIDLSE